jgi:hypothetical protein
MDVVPCTPLLLGELLEDIAGQFVVPRSLDAPPLVELGGDRRQVLEELAPIEIGGFRQRTQRGRS